MARPQTTKEQKLQALKAHHKALRENLPHLHGQKMYAWQRQFFESTNKMNLMVAGNQQGKSSVQIRKCIHWCTEPKLWPKLWPKSAPRQMWYLYPNKDVTASEFELKWVPDFLPKEPFHNHPQYGWEPITSGRHVLGIKFRSGVTLWFRTYSTDVKDLQTGTVHAIFCFPAGTQVLTPSGARDIDTLRVGDEVIAGDGSVQAVRRAINREAEVITRQFSNGESVTATPDHPFWTRNRGWIEFQNLTTDDQCGTVRAWKLIKNWSCLRASFSSVIRSMKTCVNGIISETASAGFCMSPYGNLCMAGPSLTATSPTTKTKTLSTIIQVISSCLRVPSILGYTKKPSGEKRGCGTSPVNDAERNFSREVPRDRSPGFVLHTAGGLESIASALGAKLFSRLARNLRNVSVLNSAQTTASTKVYNIEVGGPHTYFANGILVHNCDEELPTNLFPELQQRLSAPMVQGYFSMVFTATLNQEMWRMAMEAQGQENEMFKTAAKWQVSKFDCLFYEDGTPSEFTEEEIERQIAMCSSPEEVARRIYGRFVNEMGRKYHAFSPESHYMRPTGIPGNWGVYASVDPGSGGPTGHPAAMVFIAVRPDHREGWVIRGWRGGKTETTTAGDVLNKFRDVKQGLRPVSQVYDPAAKDFFTIAIRQGEAFTKAQKKHTEGEDIVNTLFKHKMLKIFDADPLRPLGDELLTLMNITLKRNAKDDYTDALRYACMSVPWDFSWIKKEEEAQAPEQAKVHIPTLNELRRGLYKDPNLVEESSWADYDAEINFLNDEYGS